MSFFSYIVVVCKTRLHCMNQLNPLHFFKCIADDTRLKTILLIAHEDELCVCELVAALDVSQPKISRHLAVFRHAGFLVIVSKIHGDRESPPLNSSYCYGTRYPSSALKKKKYSHHKLHPIPLSNT